MSTIITRVGKGAPLTNAEVDANFTNLNTDKLEAATTATLTNKTINLTSNTLVATSAQIAAAVTDETGTGSLVFATSPTLVTPALGTPSSGVLTNATGLPISTGVSGLGTGVATFLGTPSSANLRTAVTDETGTGSLVFATSPTLVTPALGTPSSGVVTNLTGTASININGTVGATTPNTGNFTVLTENASPAVVQTDIGTAPNEIPLNQYLGNLAYQDAANIAGPMGVGAGTSNPFVINAAGQVLIGADTSVPSSGGIEFSLQNSGTSAGASGAAFNRFSNSAAATSNIRLGKSRGATVGSHAVVVNNDDLSIIDFAGSDGTSFISAARIVSQVDGTPGTNDMPGRLVFSTTADGASSPTERMRITSAGNVGIGTTSPTAPLTISSAAATVDVARLYSGVDGAVQSETGIGFNPGTGTVNPAARISALELDAADSRASLLFYTRDTNSDVAPTERMRIDSAGTLILNQGQIQFPATQNASANANTLDDYEEGTWTPELTFGGATTGITYSDRRAQYVKIGRNVYINLYFLLANKGSATGHANIANLPFGTGSNGGVAVDFFIPLGVRGFVNSGGNQVSLYSMSAGATSFGMYQCNLTGGSNGTLTNTAFFNNTEMNFNFWYQTVN